MEDTLKLAKDVLARKLYNLNWSRLQTIAQAVIDNHSEIERLREESALRFKRMEFECDQHAKKCVELADAEAKLSAMHEIVEFVQNDLPDSKKWCEEAQTLLDQLKKTKE